MTNDEAIAAAKETMTLPPAITAIITEECARHHVTQPELFGESTIRLAVLARWAVIWRLSSELGMSCTAIGKIVNRDRKTVLYAINKMREKHYGPNPQD